MGAFPLVFKALYSGSLYAIVLVPKVPTLPSAQVLYLLFTKIVLSARSVREKYVPDATAQLWHPSEQTWLLEQDPSSHQQAHK